MMAKPIRALELQYAMIQVLIIVKYRLPTLEWTVSRMSSSFSIVTMANLGSLSRRYGINFYIKTLAKKLRSIENYMIITLSFFGCEYVVQAWEGWVWKEMFNFSFEVIAVVFYTFTITCWHFFTEDGSASGELSGNESKESSESSQVVTVNPGDDDKCNPNPCSNGGTCVSNYNYIDGYVCECADDFGGITCGGG